MTGAVGGDYNLGRAHGEITITADTRGAQEAQAAMAATSAEAEVLDRRMGVVTQRFEENRRASVQTAEQIMRQRRQLEDLRVTHQRYAEEYEKAQARLTRAQREYNEEYNKSEPSQRRLLELGKEQQRAKEQEERLLNRSTDAYTRYERKLHDVNSALTNFNRAHIEATTGLNRMAMEADKLGASLERVSDKLGSVLRLVGQGGIMGLFGLGSTGTMAAMGAGGLGQVTSTLSGIVLAMQQLSGIAALIPAVVGGAAVSIGTLATAFHGISDAMGAMNDPQKFIESLREIAPAARAAMLTFYSFQDAIRGVRFAIQEATFEPFVQQLQPLIYTWLPLLQNAGVQVGRTFGQMISQVMAFMQTGSAQQGFNTFVDNLTKGLQAASHAIEPLMSAMQTLSVVGSSFFERIGGAITKVAEEFNSWVQTAASSGKLQAWIDSALTAFTDLGHVIMNVSEALVNISTIGSRYGGGFLGWLSDITGRFKAWTESAEGMQKMANFFDLLHQAGQAVEPIFKLMGQALATVAGAFTRLGIEIAPAVTQFFQSIVESLHTLAPILLQMGPSISIFLVQFGQALAQLVQQAGPQLPGIFQAFTQALLLLLPVVTKVLTEVINFTSHFTPKQIEMMIVAAGAVRGLAAGFGILSTVLSAGPWGIAAAAIVGIGVAAYEAYQHWEPFKNAVDGVWHMLDSMVRWVAQEFTESGALAPLATIASKAYDWGHKLITNFIHGMGDLLEDVGHTASDIGDAIAKNLHGRSPTREGPLSQDGGTENWGAKAVTGYARGMAGATPAVASASAGVGGAAAGGLPGGGGTGTTGMGFSSAGGIGASGSSTSYGSDIGVGRGIGASGFDKYVDFLTTDLTAWSGILQGGFNLIRDTITNVAIPGIKLFADFWQGGNNPLTQPGGIFGPQELAGQWGMPGVENVKAPGHAPDEWARKLAAAGQTPGQQTPPGVTPVGPRGMARTGPGANNPPPAGANNQPPPGPGSAGGGVPPAGGASGPGGYTADQLAQSIITQGRAAGMNDQQIQAALAVGLQETGLGTNPRTNVVQNQNGTPGITGPFQQDTGYAKYGNRQDPDVAARGFIDQYVHTGQGLANPNPWDQALQVQRPARVGAGGYDDRGGPDSGSYLRSQQGGAAASILQRLGGGGGWAGQPGTGPISGTRLAEELNRRRNAPAGGIGLPQAAGPWPSGPGGNVGVESLQAAGFPPLFQNPAQGNPEIPAWVQDFVKQHGGPSLVAGSTPHGALHGTPGSAGYAVDVTGDPAEQDKLAKFLEEHPEASAMMIHQDVSGEPRGVLAGQTVAKGSTFTTAGGSYADESTMVHWAPSGGGNAPPIITPPSGAVVPGGPTPSPGTDAPNLGNVSDQYDQLPEFAKDAIIDSLVGTGLFASGAIARRVFGRRSRTGTPTAAEQPNIRRPFAGQLPSGVDYTTREALARAGGYGVRSNTTTFEGAQTYRLGPFERRNVQPTMSMNEARARLGLPPIEIPTGTAPINQPATSVGGAPTGELPFDGSAAPFDPAVETPRTWVAGRGGIELARPGMRLGPRPDLFVAGSEGIQRIPGGAPITRGVYPGIPSEGPLQGPLPPPNEPNILRAQQPLSPWEWQTGTGYRPSWLGAEPLDTAGWRYPAVPGQTPQPGAPQFRIPPTGGFVVPQEGVSPGLGAQTRGAFGSLGMGPISGPLSLLGAGFTAFGIVGQAQQLAEERRRQLGAQSIGPDGKPTGGTFRDPTFGAPSDIRIPDQPTGQYDQGGFGLRDAQTILGALAPLPVGIISSIFGGTGSPRPQAPAPAPAPPPVPAPVRGWGVPANPPAQVQGQQPSNAGQFRGVDPNQLAGPLGPGGPGPTRGLTGTDRLSQELINRRAAEGVDTRTGLGGSAGKPVPVDLTHQGGVPVQRPGVTPTPTPTPATQPPQPPRPAQPSQAPQPAQPPQPPGQAPSPAGPSGVGDFAANRNAGGINYDDAYNVNNLPKPLPFNAQTPGDAFMSGMASMGNIASDAFQVFNDVIKNISDSAAIADMLVRGPANTEDVVGIIKHFQSFLKTAADVSKMVGDVGGMVGGASGGMDMGAGGGVQAVAGMISAGIEAVNQSITLGIDIYHEVGKYAGFIIGEFLGGPNTGPLGGNVRMLLNTRTNQLQTYSEDNPLNKNTFNVPLWQRSYQTQPTPPAVQIQQNLYVGPGQTPQQNMSDQMWMATTGSPSGASVAGHS